MKIPLLVLFHCIFIAEWGICVAFLGVRPAARSVFLPLGLQSIDIENLMDMDVVIYNLKEEPEKERIGAIQEDGTLSPLSVWSDEPVFGESLEFLVDEEDRFPGLTDDDCIISRLVPQECLSYGSRQVGGGKGPGNPHGEESELLYYVDEKIVSNVELAVKPELEILW